MIIVLMAAYNEQDGLRSTLPQVPETIMGHDVEVIVLSDGSTDDTVDVARAHGCTTIVSNENRGKGANMGRGLDLIRGRTYAAAVFMDADGQHDPADLQDLVAPVLEGSADMVIGSRYVTSAGRGGTPWNRYLVRTVTVALVNRILSIRTSDPYSGYRALSEEATHCVELIGDRYESELEMLFCADRSGLRVVERPIRKVYGRRTSKMGSRHGALLGRIAVVTRYALTIGRESLRSAPTGTDRDTRATAA